MILIDQFFRMAFIGLAVIDLLLLIFKTPTKKLLLISSIYLYVAVVLGITLCPIPFQKLNFVVEADNNFTPFATIIDIIQNTNTQLILLQIGGNIALFIPAGAFLYMLANRNKRFVVPLLIVLAPIIVELLQHIVGIAIGYNYRSFDVDDITLGGVGCLIGYLFGIVALSRIKLLHRYR